MNKQCFNAHIAVPKAKQIRRINSTYMRVLRRVSGQMIFESRPDHLSDLQVRELLGGDVKIIWIAKDPIKWLSSNAVFDNPA